MKKTAPTLQDFYILVILQTPSLEKNGSVMLSLFQEQP
jgi:hypothetical protein